MDKDQEILQRALFYESQYRTAIVSDSIFFYDVNLSKNIIESDFFVKDDLSQNFISVPTYLGLKPPCRFTDAMSKWIDVMVPDKNQRLLDKIENLDEKIIEMFSNGKREYAFNYWGLDFTGNRVFYNQRFLLTKNERGEIWGLSILKDLTNLKEYDDSYIQKELKEIAYVDAITGGPNFLKIKLEISGKTAAGSIVCFDIKSFKTINTLCGITKGNDVIKVLWNRINSAIDINKGDLAAHVNADNFLIFLNTLSKEKIVKLLHNLTLSILASSIDLDIPQLNPYYGVAQWTPGKNVEQAYNEAIVAKNKANKEQLENFGFFDEDDKENIKWEQNILDSFETALGKKEFKIWFQPKFDTKTEKLCGAEALVRWIKPDDTIISPTDFIPILERNNRIKELDEYIFRSVCVYQKEWQNKGINIVPVSINLSRASLYYNGVVERYKTIADTIGINLKYIPIEITETAAITNSQINTITALFHKEGFTLHMDDFGSGYSSLSSLNTSYFDTIKLDKSLIDYIGTYNGDRLLIHTISLAKDLGISITAEGVEIREQADFLKKNGCDNIQGFFYSKPMNSAAFENTIRENKTIIKQLTESQSINNYLLSFIHGFETKDSFFYVINVTKSILVEFRKYANEILHENLDFSSFENEMNQISEDMSEKEKRCFLEFIDKNQIKDDLDNCSTTKYFEYNSSNENWRIVRHSFYLDGYSDLYCYLKFYRF